MSGSKDTPVPQGKLLPDALDLVAEIRGLIEETRAMVAATVNAGLTMLYWRVGRRIHEEILKQGRAGYGQKILPTLPAKLLAEYGRGWSEHKLAYMIRFAEVLPDFRILQALCAKLSWSHFRQIVYIEDVLKRDFYTEMCRVEGWSTRTLGKVSALMRQLSWTHFLFFHRDLRRLSTRHLEERSVKLRTSSGAGGMRKAPERGPEIRQRNTGIGRYVAKLGSRRMPPTCPGDGYDCRYKTVAYDPLSHSPAAKPPVSGKEDEGSGLVCSDEREAPPGKPSSHHTSLRALLA